MLDLDEAIYTHGDQAWECETRRHRDCLRLLTHTRELLRLLDTAPEPVTRDEALRLFGRGLDITFLLDILGEPENTFEHVATHLAVETLGHVEADARHVLGA
ncbi:hypothetical protein FSW04_17650 [Baekduia soli]|uniref:Uncharacterized protein n=1 Tax=Baekduia soli TaxID=496014 RepID=A0A5B8U803_9ACTN|nr:hypothetical protein [Baekduia soli]QEC49223.1 hypothetical protein FSW04_17650 [Baekduia soli]